MYSEFEALNVKVIAIAQEDKDLKSHSKFLVHFKDDRPFEIVADLTHEDTKGYDRTSAYLIGADGTVKQVFPAMIHYRPAWDSMLPAIRRALAP